MYADGEHVWSITWMMWMMATALAMSLTMAWVEIRNKKTMVLNVEPSCGEQNHSLYLKMSKCVVNARAQTAVGQGHETLVTWL